MDVVKVIVWFSQQGGLFVDICVVIFIISGIGLEVISVCVISDLEKGIKYLLFYEVFCFDMVIIDLMLVVSVLFIIIVYIGLDVLIYVLEVWVLLQVIDFIDVLVEKVVRLVFCVLFVVICQGDCIVICSKMYNVLIFVGMVFSQVGFGFNYVIVYQFGGQFYFFYGLVNVLLLIVVICFNVGEL